jgi:hypothetical protein
MKPIPETNNPLVLRTDFSNQAAWDSICTIIRKPVGSFRFRANVDFINELEYEDLTKDQLLGLLPKNYSHTFIILVDQTAISLHDHPLLIVDLYKRSGREFRAIPARIQSIQNNLCIANMDFEEFAEFVDSDGVFRGFAKS